MTQSDDDMPPTPPSLDDQSLYDRDEEAESDGSDDDDLLQQLGNVLADLRLRTRDDRRQRRTLERGVETLEREIAELSEENTRLEEEGRGFRIQLSLSAEQLRTAETDHAAAIERLTGQVADAERRATAAENDIGDVRTELVRARARIVGLQAAATQTARAAAESQAGLAAQPTPRVSLAQTFNDDIAEALTARPLNPQPTRYRMTATRAARGPDRRTHREFHPAKGVGRFVEVNGKTTWVQIWVQEQK
jgi:hypothetical protein